MERKIVYVYESHLGGIYTSDTILNPEVCETCGDCDWFLGEASSFEELKELVTDRDYNEDGSIEDEWCGYSYQHLIEVWSEVE